MPTALPGPLVSPEWLVSRLADPDLVVVDASWYLAAMNRDPAGEYRAGHIPGAIFWDLDAMSDRDSPLPHMLPDPKTLSRSVGALGIGDTDRVVVYDGSGHNLSAARVWWTLRAAGHRQVAVLDGGLGAWRAAGFPLEAGRQTRLPARFSAGYEEALVRSLDQVRTALAAGQAQVLDARARGRFEGADPEPRPGLRGGHIPGAKNLPYTELTGPGGRLLPPEELARRFRSAGIDLARPVITSCGSGVSACALLLGLEHLGHRNLSVYDGSWSEWGQPLGPEIEQGPSKTA